MPENDMKVVLSELHTLKNIGGHPFVVDMIDSFRTEDKLFIVLEYVTCGNLSRILNKQKKLTENVAKMYACEVILAIEHLHNHNVLYRDLKPENLLVDSLGHIKLADFGLSKMLTGQQGFSDTICGTPAYMPPEMLKKTADGRA